MDFIETDRSSTELFAAINKGAIDALVAEIRAFGSDDGCLDELVLDGAAALGSQAANQVGDGAEAAITNAEGYGSSINNDGLEAQVAFILAGNGITDGERLVRDAAGIPSAPVPA
ncbi:hypothetical protein [Bosea sp. RAC05]|uniref:hypothetical protein n=1 Tax=Bosea sp. RAC05 TaxID=1842539 RepID=UPI00083CDE1C|nr:hypothetical protein [Bosea sp. RAC05]AOG03130.1 hypothetical protein BSY19_5382 [Bosea sp. RAC05]